jgi:hypothetical protein
MPLQPLLRVYVCNDFTGYWPVGTAAVIVANGEVAALNLLHGELEKRGLPVSGTVHEIETYDPSVTILCDGNY